MGLNIKNLKNCFVPSSAVRGEVNNGIKKSLGELDKGARQVGTNLKRGFRKAVASFNSPTLSSNVRPYAPETVAQSTAFARGKVNELNQKVQEQLKDPRGAQSPRASAGPSTRKAQVGAHAERQSKASNATLPQTSDASRMKGKKPVNTPSEEFINPFHKETAKKKQFNTLSDDFVQHFRKVNAEMKAGKTGPQVRPQSARHQTSDNDTHRQRPNPYEHRQMSKTEAQRIKDIGVSYDSSDDDKDLLARAEQVLAGIEAKENRNKLKKKIDKALNPGGGDTRVSPVHARLRQEQIACENIIDEWGTSDMTSAEINALWDRRAQAMDRLAELRRFAVFDNAASARTEKMTLLQGDMAKVEKALNKREDGHPDFDEQYLHLSNAELAKQRANLFKDFTKLNLDYNLTNIESTLARWNYELELGTSEPLLEDVNGIEEEMVDVNNMAKTLNQSSDESEITRRRIQNITEQIGRIKRAI